jgi:nicotinamidase-related amidase
MNDLTMPLPATPGQSPGEVALLIIDVQRGLFRKSTPIYKAGELLDNIGFLVDRARRAGALVCYVQHCSDKVLPEGSDDWLLHPRLHPLDTDLMVYKHHGNAFEATSLQEEMEDRHIKRLVVVGLVTHGCVKATCVGARQLGYDVTLVKDGHSSFSKDAARLIEECHQKLDKDGVEVRATREIAFQ